MSITALSSLSRSGICRWLLRIEYTFAALLVALVLLLIVVNVITRSIGAPIYWIDELAIYTMVWMVFFSFPILIARRANVAVTILTGLLSETVRGYLTLIIDSIILLASALLLFIALRWFDPLGLAAAGFDRYEFSGNTFNFIYQEPTNTLVFGKYLVWLVIPLSALLCTLHALLNLLESLGETAVCRLVIGGVQK